jgi:methyl-accepting chemotaxis protein
MVGRRSFNAFADKIHGLVSQIVSMAQALNTSVTQVAEQSGWAP